MYPLKDFFNWGPLRFSQPQVPQKNLKTTVYLWIYNSIKRNSQPSSSSVPPNINWVPPWYKYTQVTTASIPLESPRLGTPRKEVKHLGVWHWIIWGKLWERKFLILYNFYHWVSLYVRKSRLLFGLYRYSMYLRKSYVCKSLTTQLLR
jgi:hypothetical protein